VAGANEPLTFHLIAHTHWDREWYLTRAAFLPRLVVAIGDLLDLLERDRAARFVLDGQTILVEDVLAVEPDWLPRFVAAVASGRLEVGPWYILADELIPSGESLVHNLLQGARDARQLGSRMNVLYSPDAFGHPAVLPALAREFGIDAGVMWRGLGVPGSDRDLVAWRGPDAATVLLHHLPAQGYEIGAALACAPAPLRTRWGAIRQLLVDRAVTPHVAVFIGADHHAPPHDPAAIRDRIQALEPDHQVRLSTLQEYFDAAAKALEADALRLRAVTSREPPFDGVAGELRWSYGYTWTLQGVHATRARLKRRHSTAELLMSRQAEPLVTLAAWHAGASGSATLRAAWCGLLQSQFHDTLCGCCADDVARDQESRLAAAAAMGRELVRSSLHALTRHSADAARENPNRVTPALVIWNPVPRVRGGIVVAEVTCFRRDILVGPPSGRPPRVGPGYEPFVLIGAAGQVTPVQVLSVTPGTERIDAARHYPDQDEVDRVLVALQLPPLPGLGFGHFSLRRGQETPVAAKLEAGAGRLANEFVEVQAGEDGRVDLFDRRTGERYRDIARLIDERDLGDCYTPWIDGPTTDAITVLGQAVIASGPLVAAIETRFTMPAAGRGAISGRRILILHADSPVVRLRLELCNAAIDHRLRIRVPVGEGASATAGAAFGFERRDAVDQAEDYSPMECPVRTAPAHRFVAAGSNDRGLAILSQGFFEYEWTARQELIVTALRSVGELSRDTLPTRPGHAGWPTPTPGAQEPGIHLIEFAIVALGEHGADEIMTLEQFWEDTFLAPQGTFIRDFAGDLSALEAVGIALEGAGLVFTSLKPAETGSGMVLRCYNSRMAPVAGRWRFQGGVESADLLRADETVVERMALAGSDTVAFVAPSRGMVTILVARARGPAGPRPASPA
jgi:alpha-mannosidase